MGNALTSIFIGCLRLALREEDPCCSRLRSAFLFWFLIYVSIFNYTLSSTFNQISLKLDLFFDARIHCRCKHWKIILRRCMQQCIPGYSWVYSVWNSCAVTELNRGWWSIHNLGRITGWPFIFISYTMMADTSVAVLGQVESPSWFIPRSRMGS